MPYKNVEKRKKYQKSWRERNKDYLREYQRKYNADNKERISKNTIIYHREKLLDAKSKLYDLLGNKCCRCGFSDFRAFQVHHKNRDGNESRRKYRNLGYVRHLISIYESLELLCSNCHSIEHYNDRQASTKHFYKEFSNPLGLPGKSKLSADDVRNIRKEFDEGVSGIQKLSLKYGVGKPSIRRVVFRQSWKGVI